MAFAVYHRRPSANANRNRTTSNALSKPSKPRTMFDCTIVDDSNCDSKPSPRSGHRIVADGAFLYCFGGYNPTNGDRHGLFPELWRLCLATNKWEQLPNDNCPEETASHSMILLGDGIFVWGGTGFPFGLRCSNTLNYYHLPTEKWHQLQAGGEIPSARYGQSMTFKDGLIYVIGGTTGYDYSMNVHALNIETLRWENIPSDRPTFPDPTDDTTPAPRYRHEIATSGNLIYVLGGGTAQMVFNFETIPAFNIQSKRWTTMESRPCPTTGGYPPPRKFHAAVQHGDYVYLCGGFDGTPCTLFNDIWRLSLADLQWQKLPQRLPRPIYFHSAAVTPHGCMYVFGGVISENGDQRSNETFKIWLTVPSLQEMVWDKITTRYHNLLAKHEQDDREQLAQVGLRLPPKFHARLSGRK